MKSLFITATIGLASVALLGCTSPSSQDAFQPSGGKADSLEECEGASLDDQNICRLENGQFAADVCCDAELGEDGIFDPDSEFGCLFGDHLVNMARMADLDFGEVVIIDANSNLEGIVLEQVLGTGYEPTSDLNDIWDMTDEGELEMMTVRDPTHRRYFTMYIWSAGDTIVGRIYYANSMRIAAEVGDGGISNCDAGFSNYDALPWFYVN